MTGAGALTGSNSVLAEEEIVAPGLVARVVQIRGEERVHVAARLKGWPLQSHAGLIDELAALAMVAVLARRHEVIPRVLTAAVAARSM